jgi:hypothetical protein
MACQKDHKIEEKKDVIYKLKVLSKTKLKPLVNFDLTLTKETWLDYRTLIRTVLDHTKTDNNGRASFVIKADSFEETITSKYSINHSIDNNMVFDSTTDNWRYAGWNGIEHRNGEEIISYIPPVCHLKVLLSREKNEALNIDSIFLFTPYSSFMNTEPQLYYNFLELECSESVKLTYYFYIKGVKSKEYTKDIFISRSNDSKFETIYELEF